MVEDRLADNFMVFGIKSDGTYEGSASQESVPRMTVTTRQPDYDAAVLNILSPVGGLDSGVTVIPKAVVANWSAEEMAVPVRLDGCVIAVIYVYGVASEAHVDENRVIAEILSEKISSQLHGLTRSWLKSMSHTRLGDFL